MEWLNFYRNNLKIDDKSNNKVNMKPFIKVSDSTKGISTEICLCLAFNKWSSIASAPNITGWVPELAKDVLALSKIYILI